MRGKSRVWGWERGRIIILGKIYMETYFISICVSIYTHTYAYAYTNTHTYISISISSQNS